MNIKKLKTKLTKNFYILEIIVNQNTLNAVKIIVGGKPLYKYFKKFNNNTEISCILTNKISNAKKFKTLNETKCFLLKNKLLNRYKPIHIVE